MSEYLYLRKTEPYLKKTEFRGRILFDLLKHCLRKGDRVLDSGCGYSPMAESLLSSGYEVTGFDIYSDAIAYLNNTHPAGYWWCIPYQATSFTGFTVLLLLGAGGAWNGKDFHDYILRVITQNRIRLVMLERAHSLKEHPRVEGYNHALSSLLERGYGVVASGSYESGMDGQAAFRIFDILMRREY